LIDQNPQKSYNKGMKKNQKSFKTILNHPIAHRGFHDDTTAENSLNAFKKAIEGNYAIEIDLRLTKDGKVVVFHDDDLLRMTSTNGRVEKQTLIDLKKLSLIDGQKIPTLKETLALINAQVPLLIEFKVSDGNQKQLVKQTLEDLRGYNLNTIAFQSFYPQSLMVAKKLCPNVPIGQLFSSFVGQTPLQRFMFKSKLILKLCKTDFLSVEVNDLKDKTIQNYRKKGKKVLTWLIDDKTKLNTAKTYADNIIFEKITI